jgi:hypothetical protein
MGTQSEQLEREAQTGSRPTIGTIGRALEEHWKSCAPEWPRGQPIAPSRVDKEVSQQNPWQDARVMEQAHEPH